MGVVIEARHLCMMMRGVEKQHSAAVTSAMFGLFRNEEETHSEFLSLIRSAQTAYRQTGPNGVPSVLHCVLCGEDFDFLRKQLAFLPNPCRIK
jgi:GTP cyclohydrolase I-like protein